MCPGGCACGDFVDTEGKVLGRHNGIIHYTIGQRKGLGTAFGRPMYVCGIDAVNNRVVLGDGQAMMSSGAYVSHFNWISRQVPEAPVRCKVRVRYSQKEHNALVRPSGAGSVIIHFDEPVRAVTPGQAAVLYDGDTVLGGGEIVRS